jgi:two-component system, OmpR family, sensor histidine kinase KdpD
MPNESDQPEGQTRGPVVAALGYGEEGIGIVRAASAIARGEGAALDCVTVDTGEAPSPEEGELLAEAQRVARSLGARVESEPSLDLTAGVLAYARRRGASTVVAGSGARKAFRRGFSDRLRAERGELRVVAIAEPRPLGPGARPGARRQAGAGGQYLAAFLIVAVVTVLNFFLADFAGYWAAAIPFLAAISLSALSLESGPVLLAAILSGLAWDLLFIPPRYTLHISRPEDAFMLGLYFLVAVLSGLMTGRLRSSARLLAGREARMSRISSLASALAGARAVESMLSLGVEAIQEALGVEAIVILREGGGGLKQQAESGWEPLDESARDAARSSYEEGKSAGRYTKLRPDSEWHFVPMDSPRGRLGVIGVRAAHDRAWDEGLESLLRTMAATLSIAAARELAE